MTGKDEEIEKLIKQKAEEIAERKIREGEVDREEVLESEDDKTERPENPDRRSFMKKVALGAGTIAFTSLGAANLFKITEAPTKSDVNADAVDGHELMSDTLSNRPSAGTSGRIFYATDGQGVYYDDGSSWNQISAGAGLVFTIQTDVTLNSQTVKVTVLEDTDNDGIAENRQTVTVDDGSNSYSLDQLDGSAGNEVWLNWELDSGKTSTPPTVNSGDVTNAGNWNSDAEWDNAVSISGTAHEEVPNTDTSTPGKITKGYSYEKIPLSNGLVGWWPLHTGGSTSPDLSGNSNDGSVTGTNQVAGRMGLPARDFDGNDDSVDVPLEAFNDLPQGTVSAWVNPNSVSDEPITSKQHNGENTYCLLHIGNVTNGKLTWHPDNTTGDIQSNSDIPTNTWTHIAVSFDSSGSKIYLNAVLDKEDSSDGSVADDTSGHTISSIGAWQGDASSYFDGTISSVRVYNRALSSSEIQTLYNWGSQDLAQPPTGNNDGVSYYPLDGDVTDSWGSNGGTDNTSAGYVSGIRGQAKDFDGTDDHISISDDTSLEFTGGAFSVSSWIKPAGNNTYETVMFKGTSNDVGGTEYKIAWDTSPGEPFFYISNGSSNKYFRGSEYGNGEWFHYVAVATGSELQIYINGALDATASQSVDPQATSGSLYIGTTISTQYFTGPMDDVRIYNRALKPREIQQLYLYGTKGIDMSKHTVRM